MISVYLLHIKLSRKRYNRRQDHGYNHYGNDNARDCAISFRIKKTLHMLHLISLFYRKEPNMNFPIPVFFLSFLTFLIVLSIKRGRQTRNQQEVNEAFLERERKANATRKKDISTLNYLPFQAEQLPLKTGGDDALLHLEADLTELSGKKILNLSRYSNTDLKLMYGPANLNELSEYDENYHTLSKTLYDYAARLAELEKTDDAIAVLEYAMSLRIDSSRIYLLLASLYQKRHTPERIQEIKAALSSMEETFAAKVIPQLESFHTAK